MCIRDSNNSHEVYLEELATAIDFFMNTNYGGQIDKLYVTGGGSKIPGLDVRLSQVAQCEMLDPFVKVRALGKTFSADYLEQIKCFAPVAIGLAMRKAGDA